jgi:hypothetical protein
VPSINCHFVTRGSLRTIDNYNSRFCQRDILGVGEEAAKGQEEKSARSSGRTNPNGS